MHNRRIRACSRSKFLEKFWSQAPECTYYHWARLRVSPPKLVYTSSAERRLLLSRRERWIFDNHGFCLCCFECNSWLIWISHSLASRVLSRPVWVGNCKGIAATEWCAQPPQDPPTVYYYHNWYSHYNWLILDWIDFNWLASWKILWYRSLVHLRNVKISFGRLLTISVLFRISVTT